MCLCPCPWSPTQELSLEEVEVRGSGNADWISECVSLSGMSTVRVSPIAAKAEWKPCRAFLHLDAGPRLFARRKAASRRSVDLGREGKDFKQTRSFPRSIKFCDIVSTFHAVSSRGSRTWWKELDCE